MSHCAGCPGSESFACARFGGEGACPEITHRPRSIEGRALAADASAIGSQMRTGWQGFIGLDLGATTTLLAARGHDPKILAILLPYWEQGIKSAADAARQNGDP
ncbi:hypothetical protein FIU97_14610 [Roseivivax sp. THAF40]|uniref:DUF7697 family protein n=1 Tax=unclassified Roseivivax TaxID=2639302 RepID=UPI001268D300|nr:MULTISPECIES: hypothetical protein [unclassified Roseivivax]QFS83981.1 hypothetical protein FIV09_14185 [Roseivivax sp. THAF197b]QFT47811.1 hypothetical protein FIU97_14610 [Roseivivax sp. THAF40]